MLLVADACLPIEPSTATPISKKFNNSLSARQERGEFDNSYMYYVYIIKSVVVGWRYVGYTAGLRTRLAEHNAGKSAFTAKFGPLRKDI